eukprot:NODE_4_length_77007_cov_1.156642.p62 type:complete len:161 gc:universal NODE_4_length_77007_cov_1.156642:76045-76527(+)
MFPYLSGISKSGKTNGGTLSKLACTIKSFVSTLLSVPLSVFVLSIWYTTAQLLQYSSQVQSRDDFKVLRELSEIKGMRPNLCAIYSSGNTLVLTVKLTRSIAIVGTSATIVRRKALARPIYESLNMKDISRSLTSVTSICVSTTSVSAGIFKEVRRKEIL